MIGYLLSFLIFASVWFAIMSGSSAEVSSAVITSGADAVSLVLTLAGSMAVWGGIMKIAEKSGLTEMLTKALRPALKLLFRGLSDDSKALRAIAMNMSANLLGLGNAATPLGIEAMRELEIEEKPEGRATKNMVLLAVMNACSVEILPTTVAALRAQSGSVSPMEILPCVIFVSVCSLAVAVIVVEVLSHGR